MRVFCAVLACTLVAGFAGMAQEQAPPKGGDEDAVGELRRWQSSGDVLKLAVSPDGQQLMAGCLGWVHFWDLATGKELRKHEFQQIRIIIGGTPANPNTPPYVRSVAFSAHGKQAFAYAGLVDTFKKAGQDVPHDQVTLWDAATGKASTRHVLRFAEGFQSSVSTLWPGGRILFAGQALSGMIGNPELQMRLFDFRTGKLVRLFRGGGAGIGPQSQDFRCVAFSADGRLVLSAMADNSLWLWDTGKGRPLRRLEGHKGPVVTVAFSPDGRGPRRALSAGGTVKRKGDTLVPVDCTIRLWDVKTGKELRGFEGHTAPINSVAWAPDGKRALSGGSDGTIRLWDTENGRELHRFEVRDDCVPAQITSVLFLPDGRRAVSGSMHRLVQLWQLPR